MLDAMKQYIERWKHAHFHRKNCGICDKYIERFKQEYIELDKLMED